MSNFTKVEPELTDIKSELTDSVKIRNKFNMSQKELDDQIRDLTKSCFNGDDEVFNFALRYMACRINGNGPDPSIMICVPQNKQILIISPFSVFTPIFSGCNLSSQFSHLNGFNIILLSSSLLH